MSLMGTLAKVAIGVAVAKGVSSIGRSASASKSGTSGGGLADMMGSLLGGVGSAGPAGGLGGLMESLSGAGSSSIATRSSPRGQTSGGLGDLLGQLTGGGASSGGLGGMLSSLAAGGAAGSLGGMLGGMLGGSTAQAAPAQTTPEHSFGDQLNSAFANGGEPATPPSAAQNAAAGLMLKAMIQAAKSDGKIDASEQEKLLGQLGDISPEERAFVQQELAAPVDAQGLARQIPDGLEAQAYTMSVTAIDLNNQSEARYLDSFAKALGLDHQSVNHIHAQLGVPPLYT
ncbi:MAG: tellurite resistance TerB family protein [Rhodobacteraceae bacterium]|nr:tellurite resistance TerB family protein [Paracoccaceae bacterium]